MGSEQTGFVITRMRIESIIHKAIIAEFCIIIAAVRTVRTVVKPIVVLTRLSISTEFMTIIAVLLVGNSMMNTVNVIVAGGLCEVI